MVTPNTLTETSNLLSQHREPERSRLLRRLRAVIQDSREITVASAVAADNPAFARLGLADAALLEVATADTPVVTMDFNLYRPGPFNCRIMPRQIRSWRACLTTNQTCDELMVNGMISVSADN